MYNKKTVKALLLRRANAGESFEDLVKLGISYGLNRQAAVTLATKLKKRRTLPSAHFIQGGKPN